MHAFFFFFFISCLRRSALFIFIFLWVRVTKAGPTPQDGCGVTICLILSFCPHRSLSLSLGLCECVSVCLAVTVAAGWGHKLCVLVRRLWVRKETEGEKRARSAALLFQWLSKISERNFFFFVNNPPLFVSVLFAPYPLCPPFFSALRRCLFPSSLNIIVCVSLLNCFCM